MAFANYPALSIRQPDIGKTLITAAYLKSSKLKNQLMRAKIGRQKLVQGLATQIMGGGGGGMEAPGAQPAGAPGVPQPMIDPLSPEMRKLVADDPELGNLFLSAVTKMNEERRQQYKRINTATANLLMAVERLPKNQRPLAYAQALKMARRQGIRIENAPAQYNQRWVHAQIRNVTALDAELTAIERKAASEGVWVQTAKGKTWMRKDRLEGMIAENAPTEYTALRKNAEWYAKVTKTPVDEAAKLFAQSKAMGPAAFWQKVFLTAQRNFSSPEEAKKIANTAVAMAFPSGKPGAAPPSPEVAATPPAGGWLARNVPYVGDELQQGLDWLSGETQEMLGGQETAPAAATPAADTPAADTPPSQYVAGREMTMGGKTYKVIRQRSDGSWIVQDESGQHYKTQGAP